MRALDTRTIASTLASATRKPHMLIEATSSAIAKFRSMSHCRLPAEIIDLVDKDGFAILAFESFAGAALDFYALEQRILAEEIHGIGLHLVQDNGSTRIHEATVYSVVQMPLPAAA